MSARNDFTLSPNKNGEYWLQKEVIKSFSRINDNHIFFDVGANIGEWSNSLLDIASNKKINCDVHLFEPTFETYTFLKNSDINKKQVKLNNLALSNKTEEVMLFTSGSLCAVNSLYKNGSLQSEKIHAVTLDDYLKSEKITHIDLLKSDTEGHDFRAMQGAEESLQKGKIDIWQFEYNSKWINSRCYLKDVFDFVKDLDYVVAKISNNGIEIFEKWHPELERFFEANYLLIKNNSKLIKEKCNYVTFDRYNVLINKK